MAAEYRLLGPFEVLVDGRPVALAGPRQRAVLVCLLAHANTVVPIPRIVDELWHDDPPPSAVNVLQSYVSQLRKALGRDAIETSGKGYLVRVRSEALDLIRFERWAHTGSLALAEERFEDASAALGDALALWRGPALADLVDEPARDQRGPVSRRRDARRPSRPSAARPSRSRPRGRPPRRARLA